MCIPRGKKVYTYLNGDILKVGSCPKKDKSVQLFFLLFCVAFNQRYFLKLFLPRKLQDFAESSPFSFIYFVCVGIPILKIVLRIGG